MRTRSYQATLAAALLFGVSATALRAETDGFWSELDQSGATGRVVADHVAADKTSSAADVLPSKISPMLKAAPAKGGSPAVVPGNLDTTPTQSIAPLARGGAATAVPVTAEGMMKPKPVANPVKAEGLDPEPDAPIRPPVPASGDPLDALSASKLTPVPAKPLDATTPDAKAPGTPATTDGAATGDPLAAPVRQAQEPLAPLNAAIKAAVDKLAAGEIKGPHAALRRKEREALAFFYTAHGFAPIWSADGKPVAAVEPVLARLAKADEDALTPVAGQKSLRASGTVEEIADSELALSQAVVSYARQATGSRVDPFGISPLIGLKRELADPSEVLEAVVAAGSGAGDKLQAFNPSEPRYVALREKLAALRSNHGTTSATPIPAGPVLKIGMRDRRVPMLRARFAVEVSYDEGDGDPTRYDKAVADAVAAFQRGNGLPPTGTLTKRTVAALSGEAHSSRQEGAIIANMEMWRWMPKTLGANHIEVNVPDYLVSVYRDGAVETQHRVVVGKTDTPTPLFVNAMTYLIVNPYWNVPQSIIKKEMLPKGGGSLNYLEGRGYSVSYRGGQAVVKQLPGDKNALGRIKFLFPNDYSVYLHDTPSKSLFAASKRAFSHGCVRVDQPFAFAESVLNDASAADGRKHWSEEKLEDMIGDKERYINLAQPLPIVIEYFTASIEPGDGRLKLREDIYGYTHAVATALGQDSEPPPEQHKAAPVVAERSIRRPSVTRAARDDRASPAPARTAEAAPSSIRSFFGGIFDPR